MRKDDLKNISYLGDGVYVGNDGFQLWLFLSNGIEEYNFIALEPQAISSLLAYYKKISGGQNE